MLSIVVFGIWESYSRWGTLVGSQSHIILFGHTHTNEKKVKEETLI